MGHEHVTLSGWLAGEGLGPDALSAERVVARFVQGMRPNARPWQTVRTVAPVLDYLRGRGAIPEPVPVPETERTRQLADYRRYLTVVRGLTDGTDQLAPGGLLVVPLRMRGLTRSVTFGHADDTWRSQAMHECGFMPIRGTALCAVAEQNIPLGDTGITIRIDDGQHADAEALRHALSTGPAQSWTGIEITVTGELDFWIAGLDGFFRLLSGGDAVERFGVVPPAFNWGAMGLLDGGSLAYLTRRPGKPGHSELGACGYGPAREQLISTYTDRIREFSHAQPGASGSKSTPSRTPRLRLPSCRSRNATPAWSS